MTTAEILTAAGLMTTVVVAVIAACSVIVAARRQADAALAAAGKQADASLAAATKQADSALAASREQLRANQQLILIQVEAALAAAGRQQWITALRNELAELTAEYFSIQLITNGQRKIDVPELFVEMQRLMRVSGRVRLMLDPHNVLHKQLLVMLTRFVEKAAASNAEGLGVDIDEIIAVGRLVLQEEEARLSKIAKPHLD